jgi:hypothetical protein
MNASPIQRSIVPSLLASVLLAGCGATSTRLGPDNALDAGGPGLDVNASSPDSASVSSPDTTPTSLPDATVASVPPILNSGVDPSIFLPQLVVGYHPTPEELATSGRACASDADCATSGGQVVFHCSTPYYGQAQCQGTFPPGDQVVPGVTPSCAYYSCPVGYECGAEPQTHSVTCVQSQGNQKGKTPSPG